MWKDVKWQRGYWDELGVKLGVRGVGQWYNVPTKEIRTAGGFNAAKILRIYGNSLSKTLKTLYPEHDWNAAQSAGTNKRVGRGRGSGSHWSNVINQRNFMEATSAKLQLRTLDDWYRVTIRDVEQCGGHGLLNHHGHSLVRALKAIYPQHPWNVTNFRKTRNNYWSDPTNQRHFLMEIIAKRLDIKKPEDWYRYTTRDIQRCGGSSLLKVHNNSLVNMLSKLYSDIKWEPWKFKQVPHGYWDQERNAKDFVESLSKQLGVVTPQDWRYVTYRHLQSLRTGSLLHKHGGLSSFLKKFIQGQAQTRKTTYPVDLVSLLTPSYPSKTQLYLLKIVKRLFPHDTVLLDYKHEDCKFKSGKLMQLDIFTPSLSLALEYQGSQHYNDSPVYGSPVHQQRRDSEKKDTCTRAGVTLIYIPYWWNEKADSVAATIHTQRPDINFESALRGLPIPDLSPLSKPKQGTR